MSSPHPNTILFARGTLARLTLWSALRLAVHASWGGPASKEKQRWLAGVLVDQFEPFIVSAAPSTTSSATPTASGSTYPPDDVYVEELLLQVMVDEFDVVLEDNSAAAVARDIVKLFAAACTGDDTFVRELEGQADSVRGRIPTYERAADSEGESGSGSEWEEDKGEESEQESVPSLLEHLGPRIREEPQEDEDGFTMVKSKGRR